MLVPINNISEYGRLVGSTYYDTGEMKIKEGELSCRDLPVLDIMSYDLNNRGIVTVVGKNYSNGNFVVSFGDSYLYSLSKDTLLGYKVSNIWLDKSGRVHSNDGKLDDYSRYFPLHGLKFVRILSINDKSSVGVAKKFYGVYNGDLYVCKFNKLHDNELRYEELYYKLGVKLGVKVCRCFTTMYGGRLISCSRVEYDLGKDTFVSFKNSGRSIGNIYALLSEKDNTMLDKYLLLDYYMSQQDRHMSNLALLNGGLYPLFDNGECLGLGSIGYFSGKYREYIERKDRKYLSSLINTSKLIMDLSGIEKNIVVGNVRGLYHV